jgi:hypothetical protein
MRVVLETKTTLGSLSAVTTNHDTVVAYFSVNTQAKKSPAPRCVGRYGSA